MTQRPFPNLRNAPAAVFATTANGVIHLHFVGQGQWQAGDLRVTVGPDSRGDLAVTLRSPKAGVRSILLHWEGATSAVTSVMNDQWERSYGDLAWRKPDPNRRLPWYTLVQTADRTVGLGVRTGPACFAAWTIDADGVNLDCDVRSGGVPVELGDRELTVCHVTTAESQPGQSPFEFGRAFCRQMCPKPKLADHIVYGFNDWYYAYGKNSPAGLLADAQLLSELTESLPNRPYCVIDDGWQTKTKCEKGQWSETRAPFDSMADLAAKMKALNVRPGIWMRPLLDEIDAWPAEWHLAHRHGTLDPTRPEVLDVVANDIRRLTEWGYELIKHDFSTFDLLGDWGPKMAQSVTPDGWRFADTSLTTAEVINRLYKTIADAAGKAIIIGCNTVSHLTAGVFELNRTGDDTSGNEWHRNPQMGVNTLAFRGIQHDVFYGADADCAPITDRIEWSKLGQWLDLLSRSGTPLFVSCDRKALTPQIKAELKDALNRAAGPLPLAEPLDWFESLAPSRWKIGPETQTYDWT